MLHDRDDADLKGISNPSHEGDQPTTAVTCHKRRKPIGLQLRLVYRKKKREKFKTNWLRGHSAKGAKTRIEK
jgi:hypothetical protein